MDCYVNWSGAAWFVKERTFAETQQKAEGRQWLLHWRLLYGVDGLDHARDRAALTWGLQGERWVDPAPATAKISPAKT